MKRYLLFAFIFILGCAPQIIDGVGVEYTDDLEVFFCPKDNCSYYFEEFINKTEGSIHCGLYDLQLDNVLDAFERLDDAGRDVQVVVDGNYKKHIPKNYSFILFEAKSSQSHNKFCVRDNLSVWTGSFNPTNNGAYKNNNNVVVINSTLLAQNYEAEFQELWTGVWGKGSAVPMPVLNLSGDRVENYFCPDDCKSTKTKQAIGGKNRIVELINQANKSLRVAVFSFTDDDIANAMILAHKRGVNVTVVLENRQKKVRGGEYQTLLDHGVEVHIDHNKATMHHKFIIIDGKIVIFGSYNFSNNANNNNDENILIYHSRELADAFEEEFESLLPPLDSDE